MTFPNFKSFPVTFASKPEKWESFGALDMEGASTQISFSPMPTVTLPSAYESEFVLFGQKYRVYSHSFLCYGINEITRRYLATIASVSIV